jgi:hypothetical protein
MNNDPRKEVLKEINKIIDEAGIGNADELKNKLKLMSNCPCYEGKGLKVGIGEKVKREPTKRNLFMGKCMRSVVKGGEGKGMAACSIEWKEKKGVLK